MKLFSVIGNISSGKSTVVDLIRNLSCDCDVHKEELDLWQNYGPNGMNMLQQLYDDPHTYAFHFQVLAMLSQFRLEDRKTNVKCQVIERSGHAAPIFLRQLDSKFTVEQKKTVWDLHKHLESHSNHLSGFIYVKRPVKILLSSINKRGRTAELTIQEKYLNDLEDEHERFIAATDIPVYIIENNDTMNDLEQAVQQMMRSLNIN
jgi:deoxynucleoside kinase